MSDLGKERGLKNARSARIHPTPLVGSRRPRQGSVVGQDLFFGSKRGVGRLLLGGRGVAGVVVTILMVLISITAVTLVGGFILGCE